MMLPIMTQRKLDRQWLALMLVVVLQTVTLAVSLYACGRKLQIGTINVTTQPRPLTAEQAAAMEDRAND